MEVLVEFEDGRRATFAPSGTQRDQLRYGPSVEEAVRDQTRSSRSPLGYDPERDRVLRIEVPGAELVEASEAGFPDFVLKHNDRFLLVEVKQIHRLSNHRVRSAQSQVIEAARRFAAKQPHGVDAQVWFLSTESWTLDILPVDVGRSPLDRLAAHLASDHLVARLVWSYPTGTEGQSTGEPANAFTTRYVERRVEDWARRIVDLYDAVESWLVGRSLFIERRNDALMDEDLMRCYAVPPRHLPILDIRSNRRGPTGLSLVPYALWITGANGRLDLFTPDDRLSVLDLAEPGTPPNWTIVTHDRRRSRKPFDQAAVEALLPAWAA